MKKIKSLIFTVIFLNLLCINSEAQVFKVTEKTANNALMDYLRKNNITNNEDQVFQFSQVEIGDINKDGKPDAVVRYVLGLSMGNAVTGGGIVVFVNTGNSLKFIVDNQEYPAAVLKSITNGIIFIEDLIHGPDDPRCCPSIKSKTGFVLANNKLKEVN